MYSRKRDTERERVDMREGGGRRREEGGQKGCSLSSHLQARVDGAGGGKLQLSRSTLPASIPALCHQSRQGKGNKDGGSRGARSDQRSRRQRDGKVHEGAHRGALAECKPSEVRKSLGLQKQSWGNEAGRPG